MKTSKVVLIVAVVICSIASVIAIVGGLYYVGVKGVSSRLPTEEEKKLVLSPAHFEEFGQTLDPKCAKYTWKRNLDGTAEIEFEYDCGENAKISITSGVEIGRDERDARESFTLTIAAYKTGAKIGGATLEERPELLTYGEQRYAAFLRNNNRTVGNVLLLRQGRVLHSLVIAGLYFDDPDDIQDLFAPLLVESKKQFGS